MKTQNLAPSKISGYTVYTRCNGVKETARSMDGSGQLVLHDAGFTKAAVRTPFPAFVYA